MVKSSHLLLGIAIGIVTGIYTYNKGYLCRFNLCPPSQTTPTTIPSSLCTGLACTPPMGVTLQVAGWWPDETTVEQVADAMVNTGLSSIGYNILHIEEVYASSRVNGHLVPDPNRFPSSNGSFKYLGDYIHSKGLKFGIYSDCGTTSCAGLPGSYGYEEVDAADFNSWGVDMLKYDQCNIPPGNNVNDLQMLMGYYLRKYNIMFNICAPLEQWIQQYSGYGPWEWATSSNFWRISNDTHDIFFGENSITNAIDLEAQSCTMNDPPNSYNVNAGPCPDGGWGNTWRKADYAAWAMPSHWNDPDCLNIGWIGTSHYSYLTYDEQKTNFSMWCIMSAPLMLETDVRNMNDQDKSIIFNTELIAIDQDPLGDQGRRILISGTYPKYLELWKKRLVNDEIAIALLNRTDNSQNMAVNWEDIGYHPYTIFSVRDCWAHQSMGNYQNGYTTNVPSHGTAILRLKEVIT